MVNRLLNELTAYRVMGYDARNLRSLGAPIAEVCAAQQLFRDPVAGHVHTDPACPAAARPEPFDPLERQAYISLDFCHGCSPTYLLEQAVTACAPVLRVRADLEDADRCLTPYQGRARIDHGTRSLLRAALFLAHARSRSLSTEPEDPLVAEMRTWAAGQLPQLEERVESLRQVLRRKWRSGPKADKERFVVFTDVPAVLSASSDNTSLLPLRRAAAAWVPVAVSTNLTWMVVRGPDTGTDPAFQEHMARSGLMLTLAGADAPGIDERVWRWMGHELARARRVDPREAFTDARGVARRGMTPAELSMLEAVLEGAPHVSLSDATIVASDLLRCEDPADALAVFLQLADTTRGAAPWDLVTATRGVLTAT